MKYSRNLGAYIDAKGDAVSLDRIDFLIIREQAALEQKLGAIADKLTKGMRLDVWERETAQILKESHIRTAILASGGRENTPANSYLTAARQLKEQYSYLHRFALEIGEGKLSEAQIKSRARLYAQSIYQSFSQVYHDIKVNREGFNLALRRIDPAANHCPQCPGYATGGQFIAAELVVPKGMRCDCRGRCRCTVVYRRADRVRLRRSGESVAVVRGQVALT